MTHREAPETIIHPGQKPGLLYRRTVRLNGSLGFQPGTQHCIPLLAANAIKVDSPLMTRILTLCLFLSGSSFAKEPATTITRHATGTRGVVATVHPIASQIALDILKDGGNAIDAAVAAGLALGVVDGFNSGIGGGCFLLIRTAAGDIVAIDGRETAPAAAHRDLFIRDGKAVPDLSRKGALAVGVPGALAAYDWALTHHGSESLANVILPSAKVAKNGFILGRDYVKRLKGAVEKLREFPGSAAIFLNDAHALQVGDTLVQSDLAATYEGIAKDGMRYFYEGPIAQSVARWMKANDGLLTETDFADYKPKLREPIRTTYRDHEVVGFPPASSGGVHVAQILNILETFDIKALPEADRRHVMAEAMKLAFADRAHWLGDSDFAKVPKGLIDKAYAKELAQRIDLNKTTDVASYGTPTGADEEWIGKHTTHFCVADAAGNWVACTQTVNTTYGSGVIVPGTGVMLNNEMDDFAAQPGVPNAFGLLGADANSVAPGKRPLSSMSPTIVLKDGKPVFSVGAAGGPTIITQALQAVVRRLDLGQSLTQCLALPRQHHQWRPDRLLVEKSLPLDIQEALKAKGHQVVPTGDIGVSQGLALEADGTLSVQSDPRSEGSALGF
ncbi:MAG: gamma-glutamyltranspeptidase/glutathione hydrolase [Verrucomicrobiales bacterium]